jgi:hypothetical protein
LQGDLVTNATNKLQFFPADLDCPIQAKARFQNPEGLETRVDDFALIDLDTGG